MTAPGRMTAWGLIVLLAVVAGCTRAHYRRQADREVYSLVEQYECDPRWNLEDYTIRPSPASRMFDPYNPDQPPMPPDDPTSQSLMHCVDGKKGWPYWHRNGDTLDVENPCWRAHALFDDQGELILDREKAIHLGFVNSREYQQALETLYLSALDVTFQRFRFDTQFFFTHGTNYLAAGPRAPGSSGRSRSTLTVDDSADARKLLATGGTMAVGLANQLVWQFSGDGQYVANTLLDFSLVQPLLRAGGRAVAMEGLTDVERALLANVRQMERFRQAFWVQLMSGRAPGNAPVRGGLLLSSLSPVVTLGGVAGTGGAVGGAGMLGLLGDVQAIENQRANVAALRSAVEQLETTYEVGRIDRYQVDFARQTLYNVQSSLLNLVKSHQDELDAYLIQLGLPPSVKARLADPLFARFNMIDPALTDLSESILDVLDQVRAREAHYDAGQIARWTAELAQLRRETSTRFLEVAHKETEVMGEALPRREAALVRLAARPEVERGDMDRSMFDVVRFRQRVEAIRADYQKIGPRLQAALAATDQFLAEPPPPDERPALAKARDRLEDLLLGLSQQVTDLSLVQARARLESITLVPVELSPLEALDVARANRLDWMNARAALVDVWRQIEIRANALQSNLNLTLGGDLSTLDNNPLRFRSTTGRFRAGVEFDAPLVRLAERNLYRESLIDYQRARRLYYAYEDRVNQSLRATLRAITVDQLNFEIRRAAVSLALTQTELTRYRLTRPPKPGEATVLGATTSRDLVDSLQALLNAQNGLLSVWIDYETLRINLDLDMGTFRLDSRCMWVDPGPISPGALPAAGPEQIPLPPPFQPAADAPPPAPAG